MSDLSKYHSFTAADIERYHNGSMAAAERHALEKAALDDPFLADALEGYALTSTPVGDIDAIKKRLEEKHEIKTIPLFSKHYKWLQIAVLFLLLAGSGWFLYKAGSFNKKEIAVAAPAKQEPPQAFSRAESKDTSNPVNAVPLPESQPLADQTQKSVEGIKKVKTENQQVRVKANEEEQKIETAATAASEQRIEQAETRSLARKMATNNKETTASAIPSEPNKNAFFYNNTRISDTSTDSVSGYIALKDRAAGVKGSNDTIKNLNVVMQPSKEGMSEVVVVDLKGKKAARAIPVAKFEELEPAEGWTNFNEYIAQNLKQPEDVKEKTASGAVELSFEVNKEGQAVNIRVEKSLCEDCDKEAIRLLKEGPKWKKKKDKKGKVTIQF